MTPVSRTTPASVALCLTLLSVAPARAEEPPTLDACPPPRTLRKCGELGERYYQSGQYAMAIQAFRQAFVLKPLPIFLYNMAQAHRLAAQREEAIRLYQRFLDEDPGSRLKPEIEGYLAELRRKQEADRRTEELLREQERLAIAAAQESHQHLLAPPPPPPAPVYKRWWFWTAVGGVVAGAVVTGAVLGTRPGETTLALINAR